MPKSSGETKEKQRGSNGAEDGAVGEVEADVRVTLDKEHPQGGAESIPNLTPTGSGNLARAIEETVGVGQPIVG